MNTEIQTTQLADLNRHAGRYVPSYGYPLYYVVPERVQDEIILAEIERSKEKMKTEQQFQRSSLELQKKEASLMMSYEIKENAEAEHSLSEVKVVLEDEKIFIKIIGTDGRVRRRKRLIEENFVSVKKIVSTFPANTGIVAVTFRKQGKLINFFYDLKRVEERKEDILDIIKKTSLTLNLSRRLTGEVREQLPKLFAEVAETVFVPYDYGYYKDKDGMWQLCKPGEATMQILMDKVVIKDG